MPEMRKTLLWNATVIWLLVAMLAPAFAQDGHARWHEYYKHWMQPDNPGLSCCNARVYSEQGTLMYGDCSPTKAHTGIGKDGLIHWFAKVPDEELRFTWQADIDGYVEIPDRVVIRERNPSIEEAHLCISYGAILCFVPPDTGG